MANPKPEVPILSFSSAEDWETWLSAEYATSNGMWLKLAKKGTGIASVSKTEAIDTALCYGWIDGQLDKFDECYWLNRFTPRKPGSKWSQINRGRATALIAQGRMRPAGMFEIERAKAGGRWNAAYAPQSTATVPDDLRTALGLAPDALRLFDRLDSANRYAILYRIHNAKGPKTRAARIEKFVAMLARGETVHPMRAKPERR